jgi:hypothetical protein
MVDRIPSQFPAPIIEKSFIKIPPFIITVILPFTGVIIYHFSCHGDGHIHNLNNCNCINIKKDVELSHLPVFYYTKKSVWESVPLKGELPVKVN